MHKGYTGFLTWPLYKREINSQQLQLLHQIHAKEEVSSKTTGQYSTPEPAKACYKMKLLLIFLAVVAATFALPDSTDEWHPLPNLSPLNAPWYYNEAANQAYARPSLGNIFQPGRIYLMLGNNNLFLASINHDGPIGEDYIQSIKSQQDESTRFAVSVLESGRVAFRDFAGIGLYLQLNPGDGVNSIRPTSEVIDHSAQFEVEVGIRGPWKGAHYIFLKADNGKYWGIVQAPPGIENNIAAQYAERDQATRLIVLEAL